MSKKIKFPALKAAFVLTISPQAVAALLTSKADMNPEVEEPHASAWGSAGWHRGGIYPVEQAGMVTFCWQTNEKILPAKVRDEVLNARVKDIEDRQGRKIGKKEYAQLRDEVCLELLPRAFIRRAHTLVTLADNGHLIIWSSSAKRCDTIVSALAGVFAENDIKGAIAIPITAKPLGMVLKTMCVEEPMGNLTPGANAVLTMKDEETEPVIRIRNKAIDSNDVQKLLKQGYEVKEAEFIDGKANSFGFVVSDKMVFKRIGFGQIREDNSGDPSDAYGIFETDIFLTTKELLRAWREIVELAGGLYASAEPDEDASDEEDAPAEDEDDDL